MWKTRVSTYAVGAAACLTAVGGLAQAAQKPAGGGGGAHPAFHAVGGGGHPAFHPSGPARLNVGPAHIGTPHITTRHIGPVGTTHLPTTTHLPITTLGTHALTTNNKLTPTKIIANPALAHHLATLKTNPHNFAQHRNLAANSALHPFLAQHMNMQHHHHHLGWVGPLFWPFAYGSVFFFALWPDDYGFYDPFWAYGYNDIYEGIFSPYVYDHYVQGPGAPARMTQLAQGMADACATEAAEVTGWPIDQIQATVEPSDQQRALLDDLGNAVVQASDTIKSNCPTSVAFTPTGRLAAMQQRLQGMVQSVNIVEPPLGKFYDSLNDEQKARFDAMGAATAGAATRVRPRRMPPRPGRGGATSRRRREEIRRPRAAATSPSGRPTRSIASCSRTTHSGRSSTRCNRPPHRPLMRSRPPVLPANRRTRRPAGSPRSAKGCRPCCKPSRRCSRRCRISTTRSATTRGRASTRWAGNSPRSSSEPKLSRVKLVARRAGHLHQSTMISRKVAGVMVMPPKANGRS